MATLLFGSLSDTLFRCQIQLANGLGENVHVYLEEGTVRSKIVSGRGGWPETWLYRGRPLGSLEKVWAHLVSREGQRELGKVQRALDSGRPTKLLDRLRATLREESVAGIDLEPYLRGEVCPNGWTNRELWTSLDPSEQATWEQEIYGEEVM